MSVLATVSFGEALLTVLEIAVLIVWIWAAIKVLVDVFRSPDLSNWSRAGWLLLIALLPLARRRDLHGRARQRDERPRGRRGSLEGRREPRSSDHPEGVRAPRCSDRLVRSSRSD